jgi:hypothetical protein
MISSDSLNLFLLPKKQSDFSWEARESLSHGYLGPKESNSLHLGKETVSARQVRTQIASLLCNASLISPFFKKYKVFHTFFYWKSFKGSKHAKKKKKKGRGDLKHCGILGRSV